MKIILAGLRLVVNFIKSVLLSGLETAKIILFQSKHLHSGLSAITYGELNETSVSILGALITLTPGTTLIDIDTESGVLVLHLLDLDRKDETIEAIQQDFLAHLKVINEVIT